MKMYSVQATVSKTLPDGYVRTVTIPTFYLDPKVQGIVSIDHAERIAAAILNPLKDGTVTVSPNAVLIDMNLEE